MYFQIKLVKYTGLKMGVNYFHITKKKHVAGKVAGTTSTICNYLAVLPWLQYIKSIFKKSGSEETTVLNRFVPLIRKANLSLKPSDRPWVQTHCHMKSPLIEVGSQMEVGMNLYHPINNV